MENLAPLIEMLHQWSDLSVQQAMTGFMHFMRENNLSFSQISVLTRLHHHGPADIITISRELQISKAGAGQLIDRMLHSGWISREISIEDKRSRIVVLTSAGKELVAQSILAREDWIYELAKNIPQTKHNEISQSLDDLNRLAQDLFGNNQICS
ncbi:MAG: MarR family transcriptional regulator [Anaerolineaceae bacterium]|nr:MarR family transcriptional regulator [Anaerolineaceae bacterium]